MTRHRLRMIALQSLFAWEFSHAETEELFKFEWLAHNDILTEGDKAFVVSTVMGTIENCDQIDNIIKNHLEGWEFSRVCKTDIAILRLSIYTLLFQKDMDKRIVINEAIMLAKEFSPGASYKYVNAVLHRVSSGE